MQPTLAGLSLINNSAAHSVVQNFASLPVPSVQRTPPDVLSKKLPVDDLARLPNKTPLQQRTTTPTQATSAKSLLIPWRQSISAGSAEEALKIIFNLPQTTDFEMISFGATANVKKMNIDTKEYALKVSIAESKTLKASFSRSAFTTKQGEICGLEIPTHPCIVKTYSLLILDETTKQYHLISKPEGLPHGEHDKYSVRACIQELITGRDLYDCLHTDEILEPCAEIAITIGLQAAEALQFLHNHGFIYRDLKPENMFYNRGTGRVKLTDLGLLKHLPAKQTTNTFCGSPNYMAPEIILNKPYDHKVDNFALGMLLCELVVGVPLFYKHKHRKKIYDGIVEFSGKRHKQRKAIIMQHSAEMLRYDPELLSIISRLTCGQSGSRMTLSTAIEKLSELQQKVGETQV